jgi:hypothetical protein
MKHIEMTGRRFGRLVVLSRNGSCTSGGAIWSCMCDCGEIKSILGKSLRSGVTQSCGCLGKERRTAASVLAKTKHGETAGGNSRTYRIWANMMTRCTNPKASNFAYYGGRGIRVCDRWETFQNFLDDMGKAPSGLTIDRKNTDLNYEPSNCRWADKTAQANNTRSNVLLEIHGEILTVAQWARKPGAAPLKVIYARVERGWEASRAVFKPVRGQMVDMTRRIEVAA